MDTRIKIFLADDTLIAREGWKKILETANDIEVVGEAETATETFRKVKELQPDVLLIDLKWYGDDTAGWTTISKIKKDLDTKVKIIAVTAFENLIRDARLAGADSALLKTFSREELLKEIREQYLHPSEVATLNSIISIQEDLTNRELEVLQLLSKGYRDKEIAKLLGIAPTTAKNHVKSILGKLNAKNRTHAVSIAREHRLIQ
jgi:DNA-binding NarL/FixJ family response regulator